MNSQLCHFIGKCAVIFPCLGKALYIIVFGLHEDIQIAQRHPFAVLGYILGIAVISLIDVTGMTLMSAYIFPEPGKSLFS